MLQDFRLGVRGLLKHPGFTLTAAISLALGIGANTTIFTVVNSVFLNPLPVRDSAQLVAVYTANVKSRAQGVNLLPVSYLNLKDLGEKNQVFSGITGFSSPMPFGMAKGAAAAPPERVFGELVTGGYFDVLGIRPALGRFFREEED